MLRVTIELDPGGMGFTDERVTLRRISIWNEGGTADTANYRYAISDDACRGTLPDHYTLATESDTAETVGTIKGFRRRWGSARLLALVLEDARRQGGLRH